MIPYIVTFFGYYIFHLFSELIKFPKKIKVIYILLLFFGFVFYTDLKIGVDMPDYIILYKLKESFGKSGPIFGYLANIFNYYNVSFFVFYICLIFFELVLLYKISNKLINYNLFLILYFSNFFLMMQFNAIRQGLSLLILCYALLLNNKIIKIFAYALSVGIHVSSLLILAIIQFKKNSIVSYIIIICSGILMIHFIYNGYLNKNYINLSFTLYPALTVKLIVMYIFFRKAINKNLFYTFFVCYIFILLGFPLLSRLTDGILMISAILYSREKERNKILLGLLYIFSIILFIL